MDALVHVLVIPIIIFSEHSIIMALGGLVMCQSLYSTDVAELAVNT